MSLAAATLACGTHIQTQLGSPIMSLLQDSHKVFKDKPQRQN